MHSSISSCREFNSLQATIFEKGNLDLQKLRIMNAVYEVIININYQLLRIRFENFRKQRISLDSASLPLSNDVF